MEANRFILFPQPFIHLFFPNKMCSVVKWDELNSYWTVWTSVSWIVVSVIIGISHLLENAARHKVLKSLSISCNWSMRHWNHRIKSDFIKKYRERTTVARLLLRCSERGSTVPQYIPVSAELKRHQKECHTYTHTHTIVKSTFNKGSSTIIGVHVH